MSNRRVKSLGYDDDDIDDYDEDEDFAGGEQDELSPEDKAQMKLGTAKVKEALGVTYSVSEKEIHDTLWHYYYDVGKSVAYLKNQHKPKPAAKPKTTESKVHRYSALQPISPASVGLMDPEIAAAFYTTSHFMQDYFADCPWSSVQEHRKATIIIEPQYPRGGLLGGSSKDSKMSKLAALAAKRRHKENENPVAKEDPTGPQENDYTSNLSRLTLASNLQSKRKAAMKQAAEASAAESQMAETVEDDTNATDENQVSSENQEPQTLVNRAEPSTFAMTLLATNNPTSLTSVNRQQLLAGMGQSFDFSQPSPDDVISNAQSGKITPVPKAKPREATKGNFNIANGVSSLKIQDPVKIKSKNIDVVSEYKKINRKNAANFVVVGHVDAGKSTLMGRLLFDLHAIDERTMEKYQKEADSIGKGSFAFAWVLDQGSEERERGVTIDIATNNFETDKTNFTILDAPGHQDFVPNMIAGASQADFAVLVIDASGSNFESGLRGQTKEHALLVRSIGVQRVIIAVNKMDTIDWNEARFIDIQRQMSEFLTKAGFQAKNLVFVPCSGLQGGNILHRVTDPKASWYKADTLVEELDNYEPVVHSLVKPLRMTVADVFRGSIQNPLSISGRIETGTVQIGEQILIMPSSEQASIRSLEVDDQSQEWAVAGQNVVLNLTDIDPVHLKTGDVVCSVASPIQNTNTFKAKILAFTTLTPQLVDVHRGRLHVAGRISQLIAILDKTTGAEIKKKPKVVQPNTVVRVGVTVDNPVPLEAGQRIVFRAGGETVAAGVIE